MIGRLFGTIIAFALALTSQAQVKGQDYTVDENGDVVVVKVVEGLALQRHEIYIAALKYLENA